MSAASEHSYFSIELNMRRKWINSQNAHEKVNSKMFSTTQLKWVLLYDRTGCCISFSDYFNLKLSLNFYTVLFLFWSTGILLVFCSTHERVVRLQFFNTWGVQDLASETKEKKMFALSNVNHYFWRVGAFWALPANCAVNNTFIIMGVHLLLPLGDRFNEFTRL